MDEESEGMKMASAWKMGLRMAKQSSAVRENPAVSSATAKMPMTDLPTRSKGSLSNVAGNIKNLCVRRQHPVPYYNRVVLLCLSNIPSQDRNPRHYRHRPPVPGHGISFGAESIQVPVALRSRPHWRPEPLQHIHNVVSDRLGRYIVPCVILPPPPAPLRLREACCATGALRGGIEARNT